MFNAQSVALNNWMSFVLLCCLLSASVAECDCMSLHRNTEVLINVAVWRCYNVDITVTQGCFALKLVTFQLYFVSFCWQICSFWKLYTHLEWVCMKLTILDLWFGSGQECNTRSTSGRGDCCGRESHNMLDILPGSSPPWYRPSVFQLSKKAFCKWSVSHHSERKQ